MSSENQTVEDEPTLEDLRATILELEAKKEEICTVDEQLSEWYAEQQFNVFGYTIKHLDEQLKAAIQAKDSYKGIQQIEIPEDSERIALRKKFHSRLLHSLRFNITWPSVLILLPFLFDFLDRINLLSPIGPLTYPFVSGIFLVLALLFISLRAFYAKRKWRKSKTSSEPKLRDVISTSSRELSEMDNPDTKSTLIDSSNNFEKSHKDRKKAKGPWPASKTIFWISAAFLLAILIFFWPVAGPWAKLIYKAPFFPSGWQILLAALGIFITRSIFALASYYRGFVNFENSLKTAVAEVQFAHGRAFKIRKSIQRFELIIKEFFWWNRVLGVHLRKPWLVPEVDYEHSGKASLGEYFPKSVLLAHALDDSAQDELARIKYENYRVQIYDEETRRGWRQRNFENFYETDAVLGKYVVDGKRLAESVAKSTLHADSPFGNIFATLLTNDDYLRYIGEEKLETWLKETQKQILNDGGLHVEIDQPGVGESQIRKWDDHLKAIVKSPITNDFVKTVMTVWGLTTEAHTDGHNKDVKTFVTGPSGLIERMKVDFGEETSKKVTWSANSNDEIRVVDLLQRIDLLYLPLESVKLPRAL
jgi:hypothetical protein